MWQRFRSFGPGQPLPNFQRQIAGPPAAQGLGVSRTSQRVRPPIYAPFSLTNPPLAQRHDYNYRLDPSGSGPGGQEVNTPDDPPMGVAGRLRLWLNPPPKVIGLPRGPWLEIHQNDMLWDRFTQDVEGNG